ALCLDAMGEPDYDASSLPNESRPEVHWSFDNPAECLSQLCESLGCRIVLGLLDNKVRVVRLGVGQALPEQGASFISAGIDPPEAPSSLVLVGGPTKFQGFLELEAVGLDSLGQIVPIDR